MKGYLDKIPLDQLSKFEEKIPERFTAFHPHIFEAINVENQLSEMHQETLESFLNDFIADWLSRDHNL